MKPTVSVVLVTRNRRMFAGRALRYIRRQTYAIRELLIVDTGERAPYGEPVIRAPGVPVGHARNLGHAAAIGDIVVHWDDDDFYSPRRVAIQVAALEHGDVTACHRCFVYDLQARKGYEHASYFRPVPFSGGTIAYWRTRVPLPPFPPIAMAEDDAFFARVAGRIVPSELLADYVYIRHRTNVSALREVYAATDRTAPVRAILGADVAFYDDISDLLPPDGTTPMVPDLRAEIRRAFAVNALEVG